MDSEQHIINPKTGMDKYDDIALRIAVIDDPRDGFGIVNTKTHNCVDVVANQNIINATSNKVCLRWVDIKGGAINPGGEKGETEDNSSYLASDTSPKEIHNSSTFPMISITSPFIWTSSTGNWCGMRFVPPALSRVIVGFKKGHTPVILGYIPDDAKICSYPNVSLGEIMIKGYGKNYVHWGVGNKLTLHAGSQEGDQDYNDNTNAKSSSTSATAEVILDGDNGTISLSVNGYGLFITTEGVVLKGGESTISLNDGDISINAPSAVNTNTASTNTNAAKQSLN